MSEQIAFTYLEKKNPHGSFISGVPLRDLTAVEFDRLPKHVQRSVRATDFYKEAESGKEEDTAPVKPTKKSKED